MKLSLDHKVCMLQIPWLYILIHTLIHRSLIHAFIHSIIHSFIYLSIRSCTHPFIHPSGQVMAVWLASADLANMQNVKQVSDEVLATKLV